MRRYSWIGDGVLAATGCVVISNAKKDGPQFADSAIRHAKVAAGHRLHDDRQINGTPAKRLLQEAHHYQVGIDEPTNRY